jgi:hypothetical protein
VAECPDSLQSLLPVPVGGDSVQIQRWGPSSKRAARNFLDISTVNLSRIVRSHPQHPWTACDRSSTIRAVPVVRSDPAWTFLRQGMPYWPVLIPPLPSIQTRDPSTCRLVTTTGQTSNPYIITGSFESRHVEAINPTGSHHRLNASQFIIHIRFPNS